MLCRASLSPSSRRKKGGAPKTRLLLLLFLVALVVLGSVIEVRVRLLPLSVPVLRTRVAPLLDARPQPQFLVWCCVERRGAPGCWELGAVRMGWMGLGSGSDAAAARSAPVCSHCCAPHYCVTLVLTVCG